MAQVKCIIMVNRDKVAFTIIPAVGFTEYFFRWDTNCEASIDAERWRRLAFRLRDNFLLN